MSSFCCSWSSKLLLKDGRRRAVCKMADRGSRLQWMLLTMVDELVEASSRLAMGKGPVDAPEVVDMQVKKGSQRLTNVSLFKSSL